MVSVAMLGMCWPLGLILLVLNTTKPGLLTKGLRGLFGKGKGNASGSQKPAYTQMSAAPDQEQQEENPKQPTLRRADTGSKIKTVFGWILIVFGIIGALSVTTHASVWNFLTYVSLALGGGVLLGSGRLNRKKEAKFQRCLTVSGDQGIVDIGKLSRTMGWDGTEADRVLTEMLERGYYGPRAYIDHERGLLVIQPEAMRDVYRAEDEARDDQRKAQAEAGRTEYERYVERIRQADVDIDDEVMSQKIRRMQSLTAAIFQEVEAHPEKKSQIDRFMNYYLPTTLKLLDSYARIEERGVTGENMAKAKADIERIADTLVAGYEKQLDTLYKAEAMDIAGDVSVIENMMKRDGLTGQDDFGQAMGGH
jgi:5-bromo-4-chloroindolyl phosphate hydrolysis protein